MNFIPVLSSPSITISVKAGIQTKSIPLGATNPLAIATALTAWFIAPAPMACISAAPLSLITPAKAPATEFGLYFAETFNTSIIKPPKT